MLWPWHLPITAVCWCHSWTTDLLVMQAPSANTRSMRVVLRGVISDHGPSGLWRGATPSVLRLILLNGSMVATYDEVRHGPRVQNLALG